MDLPASCFGWAASPAYHAIMYLMGKQTITNLQRFRGYGVIQSYPSRTKVSPESGPLFYPSSHLM